MQKQAEERPPLRKLKRFGTSRFQGEAALKYAWLRLPQWLRGQVKVSQRLVRNPGGGWIDCNSYQIYQSPYTPRFRAGKISFVK